MSKVLRVVAVVATVAAAAVTLGASLGISAALLTAISVGASIGASLLAKKPNSLPEQTSRRLFANLDPQAPRKIVFAGSDNPTAMATDIRYQSYTGADQNYLNWIICCASHKVEDIEEIWFDDYMAWSRAGGINSARIDPWFLFIDARNEGISGNGIAIDAAWGANASLTGCAYVFFRFLLTEKSKSQPSPFAGSVPTRITIRGRGMPLPDIRVPGVDPEDQSTWVCGTSGGNPALQMLAYLLGWKIGGKLAVGKGVPVSRIDLESFITAANLCDEPVALAAGGTEPRYRSATVISESDSPSTVLANLNASMNGILRDAGGKLSLTVIHNDLAVPKAHFDENDILGGESWNQTAPLNESFNIVRGRYIDPSDQALYQMKDYPEVALESPDGIDRVDSFDLPMVQSGSQAQRLAKQRLQRMQYSGTYSVTLNARAWQVGLGDVVTLSHAFLGWEDKLFRVVAHTVAMDGQVPMVLVEENAAIYAWDADESPPVEAAVPTSYDPNLHPWVQAFQKPIGGGAQLLWDDTFSPGWWSLPTGAERIEWNSSRAVWASNLSFFESTDFRVEYDAASDYMPRTQPGLPIFVRIEAQPEGVSPEVLEIGTETVEIGGPVEMGVASPADFDLELAIDWLDINGDFVSRSIVATLSPVDGEQTVEGHALAPVRGYARFSVGYPAQAGKTGTWAIYEPWLAEYQPAADVTGDSIPAMTLAPPVTINVSHTGAIKTVLPMYLANSRTLGNVDVSSQTDWVGTFPPGMTATMNNTPGAAARGTIEITGWNGTEGKSIKVESTYGGLTKEGFIPVQVNVATAPSGQGGSGGTTASDSSITDSTSSAYGAANAGPLTVTAGTSGEVTLTAPLSFEMATFGSGGAYGKWQWRAVGGSWADVASEVPNSYEAYREYDPELGSIDTPGYIAINESKTGLASGNAYEFQLLLRSGGSYTIVFNGTATAQGA